MAAACPFPAREGAIGFICSGHKGVALVQLCNSINSRQRREHTALGSLPPVALGIIEVWASLSRKHISASSGRIAEERPISINECKIGWGNDQSPSVTLDGGNHPFRGLTLSQVVIRLDIRLIWGDNTGHLGAAAQEPAAASKSLVMIIFSIYIVHFKSSTCSISIISVILPVR